MWDWLGDKARAVGSWAVENRRAIVTAVVATVVAVAVGALVVATCGAAGPLAVAALAGAAGGGLGALASYPVDVYMDPDPRRKLSGAECARTVVLATVLGAATGFVGKAALPCIQGVVAETVVSRIPVSTAAQEVVSETAANGILGATLNSSSKFAQNVAENVLDGRPIGDNVTRGVGEATLVGGVQGVLSKPLDHCANKLGPRIAKALVPGPLGEDGPPPLPLPVLPREAWVAASDLPPAPTPAALSPEPTPCAPAAAPSPEPRPCAPAASPSPEPAPSAPDAAPASEHDRHIAAVNAVRLALRYGSAGPPPLPLPVVSGPRAAALHLGALGEECASASAPNASTTCSEGQSPLIDATRDGSTKDDAKTSNAANASSLAPVSRGFARAVDTNLNH